MKNNDNGVVAKVKITVVTPSLNGIRYFNECIESVRAQQSNHVDVEHIIVDGGSTDGTVELARQRGCTVMVGKDDGLFDAHNRGCFAAQGELVGFLGCDDILLPGALEQVARTYKSSSHRWVVGGIRWIDSYGTSRGDLAAPPKWMTVPIFASLGWCCIMNMATYMNPEMFRELGGFNKEIHFGDYDFFARALMIEPFARVNQILSCFRRHGDNYSMQVTPLLKYFAEADAVASQFGPSQKWKRLCYRYLLKSWLNARNPSWFMHKCFDKRISGFRA